MEKELDYRKLYETHPDFRRYVDKEVKAYHYTIEQVLDMFIVKEVGKMYAHVGKSPLVRTEIRIGCGCAGL